MMAPTDSPMAFFQSEKQRIMQKLYPQPVEQQGGEAYGGDYGGREADRMRAGGANLTAGNVLGAMGNAFGLISGSMSPTGLMGLGAQATGITGSPTSLQDQLMNGGLRTKFEGGFQYDDDLMQMVRNSRNPQFAKIEADKIQRERNARKALTGNRLGNPMGSRRLGGGFGGRGMGRSPSGGSVRGGIGAQGGAGVSGGYGGGPGGTGRGPK